MIESQIPAGKIDGHCRVQVRVANRINAEPVPLLLQVAIAFVHRADRAEMIAFAKQQLQGEPTQTLQARTFGDDRATLTAGVEQDGTTFGLPWISTIHMRQPPHGERCFK
jgi:hypothetical protein